MFRLILFITLLGTVSLGINWLMENDGTISATWLGYRIEASVSLVIIALNILLVAAIVLAQAVMWLMFLPSRIMFRRSIIQYDRGLHALTEGFAAIASGDAHLAKKSAKITKRYLGENQPLALLVDAQAAQMEGDEKHARKNYEILLGNKSTRLIGLKGLINEVKKEGRINEAIMLAEEAYMSGKEPESVATVLTEFYKRSGNWQKALKISSRPGGNKFTRFFSIKSPDKKRELATLNYMQAKELFDQGKMEFALGYLYEALNNYSKFTPAIILQCEILTRLDRKMEASRIIRKTWRDSPLPQLAEIFLKIHDGEKQLKEAQKLISDNPDHAESKILVAEAAMNCGEFSKAKEYLKEAIDKKGETVRMCNLMASVEEAEGINPALAQDWKERAEHALLDSSWTCRSCGYRTGDWKLICNQCNSIDTISWENWQEKQGGSNSTPNHRSNTSRELISAID